jgi:hypothetical protein
MKSIDNLRQYFPVVIFSTLLIASTVEANAQNRRNEGKKGNGREWKEYRETGRDDNRTAYNDRREDRDRSYERKNWNDREYRPKYTNRYKHSDSDYFEHPKYGRVYQRFDRTPVVFHHDRDDYYYYGNHFYNYRRGIGYCVVEPPRYFRTLPFGCERVRVDGRILFRNGDLYFQLSPRGYVIVPSPLELNFSLRF